MDLPRLDGARIGVVVEHKFIPEEIETYRSGFALLGAEVELLSRLWYDDFKPDSTTFFSDVDPGDGRPWEGPSGLTVRRDISAVKPTDYAAVIMAANYTSVRLRYVSLKPFAELTEAERAEFDPRAHCQAAPVVAFFAEAMAQTRVVKALLCHGLWVLTPNPHLLRGRSVICHSVVMADVLNCEAEIRLTANGVVVDGDLVTGFSKHEAVPFVAAIARQIAARRDTA